MFCNRILGTTHHGTYKKVIDVPLLKEELSMRSIRCIARDGVEIEMDLYEDLQEGDIVAETEQNVRHQNLRAEEKGRGIGRTAEIQKLSVVAVVFRKFCLLF